MDEVTPHDEVMELRAIALELLSMRPLRLAENIHVQPFDAFIHAYRTLPIQLRNLRRSTRKLALDCSVCEPRVLVDLRNIISRTRFRLVRL